MQKLTLKEWLQVLQKSHVTDMDLSLERVTEVAKRLNLTQIACPVITVGGTNGKGSTVAGLEAIYMAAGYRVGTFNSPILFRHNEYIRLQGQEASDEAFCTAFEKIEKTRGEITLTPFEYNALAAFIIFHAAHLDVWILEVGLGGRFDAVNVIDADVAVVTSIGIDHVDWLGDTREKIGYEKAGIFRHQHPAVIGDIDSPQSLLNYAKEIDTPIYIQNKQFGFARNNVDWSWWSENTQIEKLPIPQLALQNMSSVLKVVELLQAKLPVSVAAIKKGLSAVTLTGRIQVFPGAVRRVFDVSHNPQAAEFLADWLRKNPCQGKTRAVFSMLMDKDIGTTLSIMQDLIDEWYIAPLTGPRAASLEMLEMNFQKIGIESKQAFVEIQEAYQSAVKNSEAGDSIVVFGSFHTVAAALATVP